MDNKFLIVIFGPTAVGKTAVAVKVAEALKTEILSSDSRQLYKELTIGTAVPSKEYLSRVKHHFIRTISVADYYNASKFEFDALEMLRHLYASYNEVVMTGGSGLYINAVLQGIDDLPTIDPGIRNELKDELNEKGIAYIQEEVKTIDPVYYNRVDIKNPKRLLKALEVHRMTGRPYSEFLTQPKKERHFIPLLIGLDLEREMLYERINGRVDKMIEAGLLEEAHKLYPQRHLNALNTVGYRELFRYFEGKCSLDEAIEKIKANTRKYARKQLTWFRRYKEALWFRPDEHEQVIAHINAQIS